MQIAMTKFENSSRFILRITSQPRSKSRVNTNTSKEEQVRVRVQGNFEFEDVSLLDEPQDGDGVGKADPNVVSVALISNLRSTLGIINNGILEFNGPKLPSRHYVPIPINLASFITPFNFNQKPQSPIKVLSSYSALDAPGLRNDYYSNLVSWSEKTNSVAVGLGKHLYLWNSKTGVALSNTESNNNQLITCVSFSKEDYYIVGTSDGRIMLMSQSTNLILARGSRDASSICCVQWKEDGKTFFVGESTGIVSCYVIESSSPINYRLLLRHSLLLHKQQICGMAISNDEKEIAIGGNDNICTIWNIEDMFNPSLKFILKHAAAVKAIAYCPWSTSLLATGGGTKDKNIRFWHTNTGTLLHSHNTNYQVTTLVWSKYHKEIIATYGFGEGNPKVIISQFKYPSMKTVAHVHGSENMRILSSAISKDCTSICCAANDETVRFYKLWDNEQGKHLLTKSPEANGSGSYGSSIIELHEGINKRGDVIR